MREYLELILQCGALGLLGVLFFGAFRVALVWAPLAKDFLTGLITSQQALLLEQRSLSLKLDEARADIEAVRADIQRMRDDVLAELGARGRTSVTRTPASGMQPVSRPRPNGGA